MPTRTRRFAGLLLAAFLGLAVVGRGGSAPGPAFRLIDIASGRTLAASREDLLRQKVLPGSIAKVATLVAALESGVIRPDTRIACPRQLRLEGHDLACSHPDLHRPLGPAEALAHSCNGYFAAVAGRLPREALDRALVRLGLPPTSRSASVAASALGIDGTRVEPEQMLAALVRLTGPRPVTLREDVRRVVLDGLAGAAEFGTASAFHERRITALAKTGTAAMPGGGFEGLVVAVSPAESPTRAIVLMAPGAAGMDAARLAADVMATNGRPAPNDLRIGVARRGGYDVVTVPIEEYVSRVVAAEAVPTSTQEARKALAIAVRTFALRNRGRHAAEGFDLCDLTHCQVMGRQNPESDAAARATASQALFFGGRLADVFYTASCGGRSERPSAPWPGRSDPAYLRSAPEPECQVDTWRSDVVVKDLQRALAAAGRRGDTLRDLRVTSRSESGRVTGLVLEGLTPGAISGEDFRLAVDRTLGWQVLQSTLFDIERTGAGYRFRGRGRGHGVGLCELGSARLAAGGATTTAILARYFPGTDIRPASPPETRPAEPQVAISLPAAEERERQHLLTLVSDTLREYEKKLGVPRPSDVRLIVHPTVDAYVKASGQPWWTSGSTAGSRIDMAPLDALRRKNLVEATLRHELAHVMTAGRLGGRPRWVQEALAIDLSGDTRFSVPPGSPPAGKLATCPADPEWRAAASAAALEKIYGRAVACFAAQRAAGRRWDDIR